MAEICVFCGQEDADIAANAEHMAASHEHEMLLYEAQSGALIREHFDWLREYMNKNPLIPRLNG